MKPEKLIEYKSLLKNIEKKIQESEDSLKKQGINTPVEYIELEDSEKISFPTGNIRSRPQFEFNYKFNEYISRKNLRRNLSYALQCLDLFSYLINRFYIGLSAGKIFRKLGIINIFSIIEGLLYGSVEEFHKYCLTNNESICKKHTNCPYYFKTMNKYSFKELIDSLQDKGLLKLTDEGKDLIRKFKKTRDNVHIQFVDENEFFESDYSLESYNNIVKFLKYLRDNYPANINKFITNRTKYCIVN